MRCIWYFNDVTFLTSVELSAISRELAFDNFNNTNFHHAIVTPCCARGITLCCSEYVTAIVVTGLLDKRATYEGSLL